MAEYICKEVPTDNGGYLEIMKELVRCRECRFGTCIEAQDEWWECWHDERVNHGDGFCNWAERKDNDRT